MGDSFLQSAIAHQISTLLQTADLQLAPLGTRVIGERLLYLLRPLILGPQLWLISCFGAIAACGRGAENTTVILRGSHLQYCWWERDQRLQNDYDEDSKHEV